MTPDLINGLFEFVAAGFLCVDVHHLYRDRTTKGVFWPGRGFFTAWGLWNLFYYPNLNQWFSFTGGVAIVTVNLIWCILAWRYHAAAKREVLSPVPHADRE